MTLESVIAPPNGAGGPNGHLPEQRHPDPGEMSGHREYTEQQFEFPEVTVLPGQPTLPGMEISASERRRQRGREATKGVGGAAVRTVTQSAPAMAVRGAVRDKSDLAIGAALETTDKARARGSSRLGQLAAAGSLLKAGAGTILEDRSLGKVDKYARRVVKNAAKHEARRARSVRHSKGTVRALREGSPKAVTSMAKAATESVRASYSDWRVKRNAAKLARHTPKLDRRSRAVSSSLASAMGREDRGNRRRAASGVKPMSSAINHRYVAERQAYSGRVAERRRQAEQIIAGRSR